jgi:PAS domain S-box-containing protein
VSISPEVLIRNSTVAAVVSDPRQPDNPIIACNAAFTALTGYDRDEIIGRNCRFLRGEGTEPEMTAMLREAVANGRPAMVELTNYRKDGSRFRNAVMIAPLFDENGDLLYFLGSQVEIAESGADRAEAARQRVERLSVRQKQVLGALARGRLNNREDAPRRPAPGPWRTHQRRSDTDRHRSGALAPADTSARTDYADPRSRAHLRT